MHLYSTINRIRKIFSNSLISIRYQLFDALGRSPAVGAHPGIFLPLMSIIVPEKLKPLLIKKNTQMVIEGFPRSANTFFTVAFTLAQKKNVRIAHHLHKEVQVLAAATRNIPVCVLIRQPVDAVRSYLVYQQNVSEEMAFRKYSRFYNTIFPLINRCYVAFFEDVINDAEGTMNGINNKFGTSFATMPHTQENIDAVMKRMEEINAKVHGGDNTKDARPDSDRKKILSQISIDETAGYVIEAKQLYDRYLALRNE